MPAFVNGALFLPWLDPTLLLVPPEDPGLGIVMFLYDWYYSFAASAFFIGFSGEFLFTKLCPRCENWLFGA